MAVRTHWRRRLLTGSNAAIVVVLGLVVAGLGAELLGRVHVRVDLSQDGNSTLLPALETAMAGVDATATPIKITAFSAQRRDAQALIKDRTIRDLLRELEARSSNVTTQFVDFDADRLTVEQMRVQRYGTVVVEARGDRVDVAERDLFKISGRKDDRRVEFLGEGALAKAIAQVNSGKRRVVYLSAGHGEPRLGSGGGVESLVHLLENQGLVVQALELLGERGRTGKMEVPTDAAAVLVIGPTAPFLPEEDRALAAYVGAGGAVGYFVDAGGTVARFVEELGVTVPAGVVLDRQFLVPFVDRPVLRYGAHPTTATVGEDNLVTVLPAPAPIVAPAPRGTATPILETSRAGWIERSGERPPEFTPGVDVEGPVTVALGIDVPATDGKVARVAVFGDAEWVGEELLTDGPGNGTLLVNVVQWLVGADAPARIGRAATVRKVVMSDTQLGIVRAVVLGVAPALALIVGALVLATRRGR